MNELLTKQLEQISKIISGLNADDTDIDKLNELGQSLELISHQVKTSYFYGPSNNDNIVGHGINQDAVFTSIQNSKYFVQQALLRIYSENLKMPFSRKSAHYFHPNILKYSRKKQNCFIRPQNHESLFQRSYQKII